MTAAERIRITDTLELPLERSRRRKRTLAIVPQRSGEIVLQIPYRMSRRTVDQFVRDQSAWIIRSFEQAAQRQPAVQQNSFLFLGQEYALDVLPSALLRKKGFCELHQETLQIHVPAALLPEQQQDMARQILADFLRTQAGEILKQRADIYAEKMNVRYCSIKLTDPRARWGSCDRFGNLALSWRVVMAPMELIDYLIVHELAHIIRFDHSPAYWHEVERILPDYKARRKALQQMEHRCRF